MKPRKNIPLSLLRYNTVSEALVKATMKENGRFKGKRQICHYCRQHDHIYKYLEEFKYKPKTRV